ncbi:hypothetical protein Tco_0911289 [Tanacetum coccineum]|uniref:Uncharacterized protein n=1 Tax=Tanacetum coccineum TaxID=301880 RepID=A0ABQ5D2H0_9ASTR
MSTPTQWDQIGTPTQYDMLCDTFWVSLVAYSAIYSKAEYDIYEDPFEEPNEEGKLEESREEDDSDLLSDARSRPGPAELGKS